MRIVATHKNTDFDALASVAAALCLYPDAAAVLPYALNPNIEATLFLLGLYEDTDNLYHEF